MADFTSQLDMDQIFRSTEAVLNGARNVFDTCNSICGGGIDPTSRRNDMYAQSAYATPPQFQQYNYGYEENPNYPNQGFYGGFYSQPQYQMPTSGYYGFWNPRYGKDGGR